MRTICARRGSLPVPRARLATGIVMLTGPARGTGMRDQSPAGIVARARAAGAGIASRDGVAPPAALPDGGPSLRTAAAFDHRPNHIITANGVRVHGLLRRRNASVRALSGPTCAGDGQECLNHAVRGKMVVDRTCCCHDIGAADDAAGAVESREHRRGDHVLASVVDKPADPLVQALEVAAFKEPAHPPQFRYRGIRDIMSVCSKPAKNMTAHWPLRTAWCSGAGTRVP